MSFRKLLAILWVTWAAARERPTKSALLSTPATSFLSHSYVVGTAASCSALTSTTCAQLFRRAFALFGPLNAIIHALMSSVHATFYHTASVQLFRRACTFKTWSSTTLGLLSPSIHASSYNTASVQLFF